MSTSIAPCTDHVVGGIAGKTVTRSNWETELTAFEATVTAFMRDTPTKQVPHPGFVDYCNFCPVCGAKNETVRKLFKTEDGEDRTPSFP